MSKGKYIKYGVGFLIMGVAVAVLMGYATMFLWNWLIPEIFGGKLITFWQAIGLILLGKLLTGMLFWGHGGWKHRNHGWKGRHWKEKLAHLTPEEREKFKHYYYKRCGIPMDETNTKDAPESN